MLPDPHSSNLAPSQSNHRPSVDDDNRTIVLRKGTRQCTLSKVVYLYILLLITSFVITCHIHLSP